MSPGLIYLEQVCQMLEETARKQMRDRALQMERDALQEHQEMEVSQVKTFIYRAKQFRSCHIFHTALDL